MDDFSNDASTTGLYRVRQSPLKGFNETITDVDWIRVEGLKAWHRYNVWFYADELRPAFSNFNLVNANGQLIERLSSRFPVRAEYQHLPSATGPLFLETSKTGGDYNIFIREQDEAANSVADATPMSFTERTFLAGAIGSDDVDYLSLKLRSGIEYTIDLLGAASSAGRSTTLDNPLLRIFNLDGRVVASDNNSGSGRNAKVVFTPRETSDFVFQVVGFESIGSYILESQQFDDFGVTAESAGALVPAGSATMGRSDFAGDVDWFRVPLKQHLTYEFTGRTLESGAFRFDLRDIFGFREDIDSSPLDGSAFRFTVPPGQTGDRFVNVTSDVDFELNAIPVDVIGNSRRDFVNVDFITDSAFGAIEEVGDRDWFRKQLATYGKYRVEATPISAQSIDAYEITPYPSMPGSAFDTISGSGIFVPQERLTFFDVGSANESTAGVYELQFIPLDAAPESESTRWNVRLENGKGRIRNAIETLGDVDWHRIVLQADTWYEFDVRTGNTQVEIRKPDGSLQPVGTNSNRFYFADQAGEHYLIAKSEFRGGIEIFIDANSGPSFDSQSLLFVDALSSESDSPLQRLGNERTVQLDLAPQSLPQTNATKIDDSSSAAPRLAIEALAFSNHNDRVSLSVLDSAFVQAADAANRFQLATATSEVGCFASGT